MSAVLTVERIETAIENLAQIIVKRGDKGIAYLPIYERLEKDLAEMREREDTTAKLMQSIRDRVKQSQDRMAAQS